MRHIIYKCLENPRNLKENRKKYRRLKRNPKNIKLSLSPPNNVRWPKSIIHYRDKEGKKYEWAMKKLIAFWRERITTPMANSSSDHIGGNVYVEPVGAVRLRQKAPKDPKCKVKVNSAATSWDLLKYYSIRP